MSSEIKVPDGNLPLAMGSRLEAIRRVLVVRFRFYCADLFMAMHMSPDALSSRFAETFHALRQVLLAYEVPTGSVADLEPFAERLDSSETLAAAVARPLRQAGDAGDAAPNRMEMLNLLCLAVSGSDVESAGPALRRCLHRMLVFVNGVLLSIQATTANSPRKQAQAAEGAGESALVEARSGANSPDNFYVTERFDFKPSSNNGITTKATLPATSDDLGLSPGIDEREKAAASEPAWRSTSLEEAPSEAWSVDEDEEDEDAAVDNSSNADPALRIWRPLSQPALLACALVLGFGGGMLVPRSTPVHAKPLAAEPAESGLPRTLGPRDAAVLPSVHQEVPAETSGTYASTTLPQIRQGTSPADAGFAQACVYAAKPAQDAHVATRREDDNGPAVAATVASAPAGTGNAISPEVALRNAVYCPQPAYPALAALTHAEGEVSLAIDIAQNGTVLATRVLDGPPLLRGAAEHAVRHWRFRPFLEDGKAVPKQTQIAVAVRPPV